VQKLQQLKYSLVTVHHKTFQNFRDTGDLWGVLEFPLHIHFHAPNSGPRAKIQILARKRELNV